ncbi:OmpH family outer membrane protein [Marinospirillum sp.]|uniref:OmpH family outer membrane protein n=1 Tax=Marinospirillum sp. TaxID=2183934 RepID=UPI003A845236
MKRFSLLLIVATSLVFSLTALADQPARAQRIAVLDWQQALMSSEQARADLQAAEERLGQDQNRARQLREEANALQERMQRDGDIMSSDERRRLNQEIEQKAQEFQFLMTRLQRQQQELQQEIVERHRPALEQAVNELIEEHQIDVLLDRQAVAFVRPQYDLTPAVAEKLNAAQ